MFPINGYLPAGRSHADRAGYANRQGHCAGLPPMMLRFTVERVRKALDTTFPKANAAVKTLEELGLIGETTGNKKNRSFSYSAYITLLSQ